MIEEKDRIKWKRGWDAAGRDSRILTQWVRGEISTQEAIRKMSINNGMAINERQFLANVEWLGFSKKVLSRENND